MKLARRARAAAALAVPLGAASMLAASLAAGGCAAPTHTRAPHLHAQQHAPDGGVSAPGSRLSAGDALGNAWYGAHGDLGAARFAETTPGRGVFRLSAVISEP